MTIQERQSEDRMVDLLAAQRQMYRDAKRLRRVRLVASIGLALLAPVLVVWWKDATAVLGAAAAVALILNRAFLGPWELQRRQQAVAIQEEFDTYVLDLPSTAVDPPVSPQVTAAATRRYHQRGGSHRREKLRRWYPDTGSLPHPFDSLACQRVSLSWTSRLHTEWAWIVLATATGWFLVGVAVALQQDLQLSEYLVQLFLPAAPAFLDALDCRDLHMQRADRIRGAEEFAAAAWREGIKSRKLPVRACRQVQDRIRAVRDVAADVPDFYYETRRSAFEADMQAACDHLISEASHKGVI